MIQGLHHHLVRNRFLSLGLAGLLGLGAVGGALTPSARADERDSPVSPAVLVGEMTGADATTNTSSTWDVGATDLGIMWDDGSGHVLTAFGDTFSTPGSEGAGVGNWRSNVLLRSSDRNLSDGMSFDWAVTGPDGTAKEIIGSRKIDNDEMTSIPTAAISVGSRQYLDYMSVRHWGPPGQWDTNFSQLAYSDDGGRTWSTQGAPRWPNNADGTDPMQMQAFARDRGWVYVFGTPNGRLGAAHLARVRQGSMLDKGAYEYWTGSGWSHDYSRIAAVVAPQVAELSVRKDPRTGKWYMIHLDGHADLVLRVADRPEGPWSPGQLLASQAEYPGLYGGFIHPWSPSGRIYFAMSIWNQYNPALMSVDVSPDGTITRPNLLTDPSFERSDTFTVPGGWRVRGTGGIDTNSAWAKLDRRQFWVRSDHGSHEVVQTVGVQSHRRYRLTGWLRTGGGTGTGTLGVRIPDGRVLTSRSFDTLTGWTRMSVEVDSGNSRTLEVFAGSTMTADRWVQGDDFSFVELADHQPRVRPGDGQTAHGSVPSSIRQAVLPGSGA